MPGLCKNWDFRFTSSYGITFILFLKVLFPSYQAKFLDFKIQNMVGSCDVKFPIRLEGLVLMHSQFSRFDFCLNLPLFMIYK